MSLMEMETEWLEFSQSSEPSLGKTAAILEACVLGMEKRDWILTGARGQVAALLRGASMQHLLEHPNGTRNYKIAPVSSSASNRANQAIGLAIASQRPVLCVLGMAALGQGSFFEALNIVAEKKLPVLFVVITRDLSSAPLAQQFNYDLAALCSSFGLAHEKLSSKSTNIQPLITEYRAKNIAAVFEISLEK